MYKDEKDLAEDFALSVKELLLQREEEHRVYVNYANGYEGESAWYGAEANVRRLRELKLRYDPLGMFSVFGPVSKGASKNGLLGERLLVPNPA